MSGVFQHFQLIYLYTNFQIETVRVLLGRFFQCTPVMYLNSGPEPRTQRGCSIGLSQAFFWTFRKKIKAKKTQAEKKTQANFRKTQANYSKPQ